MFLRNNLHEYIFETGREYEFYRNEINKHGFEKRSSNAEDISRHKLDYGDLKSLFKKLQT